jgi:hypothetical protein
MSEALQIPAEETPAKPEIDTKYEIARVIEARAVQGYKVESLSDTRAVLVINGRKRLFGLRAGLRSGWRGQPGPVSLRSLALKGVTSAADVARAASL